MKHFRIGLLFILLLLVLGLRYSPRPFTEPKRYVALLTQSGTSDPTVTILENSLGGEVIWSRVGQGRYDGTLTGAFPAGKTFVLMPVTADPGISDMRTAIRNSNDSIEIVTNDADGNLNGDLSDGVDIRVYP